MARPRAPDELSTVLRPRVPDSRDPSLSAWRISIVEGADAGGIFAIEAEQPARVLVGTGAGCQLRLSDRLVSRRHVALEVTEDGLRVTDLESTNGTFVNGLQVHDVTARGGELLRLGETTLRLEVAGVAAPAQISDDHRFGRLVGASREMRRLYPLFERLANSDVAVVIEGETGTGKEVLAEALHEASARASGPFIVFDCSAAPPGLIESALFGHERGAFTGAVGARRGVFELAHEGTLFLDEIGELDASLQPRLLRAVQRGQVQRMGSERMLQANVRVVAATRRDLDREVAEGRFREDLFYRLAVGRIELPPLRRRHGDVAVLARHFWRALGGEGTLPAELLARLEAYSWPGNVRELENAIARRIALGDLADLAAGRSAETSKATPSTPPPPGTDAFLDHVLGLDLPLIPTRQLVVDELERRYVERVLVRYGGSVARAAAASGLKRRYFQVLKSKAGRSGAT